MASSPSKSSPTKTTRTARRTGAPAQPSTQPAPASPAAPEVAGTVAAPLEGRSELVHLDPRTLLIEGNIRRQADLGEEFVTSIGEHGVLVPIVAIRTGQGVQVRFGQRRTLAAIEAGRSSVPVMVLTGEPGPELDRIIQQWHENQNRRGLGVADQAAAAQQLSVFGLDAEQISARLGTSKPRVAKALQVGASELATKAADRYDLTLDQAAVVAEFDGDKESLTLLIAAAKEGPVRFAHATQVVRDARELAAKIAEATAKLERAKVRIITRDEARAAKSLNDLTADEKREAITPAQHRKCPGNAAYIAESWRGVETVHVCTDWRGNGHHSRWGSWQDTPAPAAMTTEEADALTEQQRQRRRTVIDNNKKWASAETVRRGWLKTFLTRRSLPKGAVVFLATELAHCDWALRKALESNGLLPELLGCKGGLDLAAAAEKATDARAQVIALGVILAALEGGITREAWRTPQAGHKRYLRFLASIGYQLSDVEQLVIGPKKPTRKTRTSPAPAGQPDQAGDGEQTTDAGENGEAA